MTGSRNPYVFIVGCPRSGTTVLQRMVDAHPHIAITPETHWIARWYERRIGLTPEGLVTPRLLAKLFAHPRFRELELEPAAVMRLAGNGSPAPYVDFMAGVFDLFAERRGKPLSGDKTPGYVRSISTLHALWPDARFVHIIRDGRDVCLSMLAWRRASKAAGRFASWDEDPVMTTAVFWEWNVRLGRERGQALGSALYREVRYEDLVTAPAAECGAICEFLNLPYDDGMVRFHEGRMRIDPGLDAKDAWLPVTAGLRDWRGQMPAGQVERFEAGAGELLEQLGYERSYGSFSAELTERAQRIRSLVIEMSRQRAYLAPERWQHA